MEIWAIYVEGAPPCCSSRPFRALKLTGQNRPENRKEPWTNLELNPDVLSSFEAASGELLVAILSRSSVSRYAPMSIAISFFHFISMPGFFGGFFFFFFRHFCVWLPRKWRKEMNKPNVRVMIYVVFYLIENQKFSKSPCSCNSVV